MNRTYYKLWYRLDGKDSYLIWYSNAEDGVVTDPNGRVPSFRDAESLLSYAEGQGIDIDVGEPILHNLDVVAESLRRKDIELINCSEFNSTWNLFTDFSVSVNDSFDPEPHLTKQIYDKLFWGCNLPSITPEGKQYRPAWSERELQIMHEVLGSGMLMFKRSLYS